MSSFDDEESGGSCMASSTLPEGWTQGRPERFVSVTHVGTSPASDSRKISKGGGGWLLC